MSCPEMYSGYVSYLKITAADTSRHGGTTCSLFSMTKGYCLSNSGCESSRRGVAADSVLITV